MPEMMLAARLRGPRQIHIEQVEKPSPGPGEVLVQVAAVSLCRSDISFFNFERKEFKDRDMGLILGHEASGRIAQLGPGVEGLALGQPVAIDPSRHCGACDMCRAGRFNICRNILFLGYPPTHGALQQYLVTPAALALPLPWGVSLEEGAMVEPVSVGVQAVRQAGIKPGQSAVVLGLGAIGLSILQVLRAYGIEEVVAVEPIEFRRNFAAKHGAQTVVRDFDEALALLRERNLPGFQFVFEATGAEEAPEQATALADWGGTLMIVGIIASDDFRLTQSLARNKELTIMFDRRSNNTMTEALRLIAESKVTVDDYATHTFPLAQTEQAYRLSEERAEGLLRAVVRVDQ